MNVECRPQFINHNHRYVTASKAGLLEVPTFDAVKHVDKAAAAAARSEPPIKFELRGSLAKHTKPATPAFRTVKFAKPKTTVKAEEASFSVMKRGSFNRRRESQPNEGGGGGGGSGDDDDGFDEVCNNLGNCTCPTCR